MPGPVCELCEACDHAILHHIGSLCFHPHQAPAPCGMGTEGAAESAAMGPPPGLTPVGGVRSRPVGKPSTRWRRLVDQSGKVCGTNLSGAIIILAHGRLKALPDSADSHVRS